MRFELIQLCAAILHDAKQGSINTRLGKCSAIINEAEDINVVSAVDAQYAWTSTKDSARRMATHAGCHDGKDLVREGLAA